MPKHARKAGSSFFLEDSLGPVPVTVLQSGLHVANYGSYHTFEFDDGSLLSAVSRTRSEAITLTPQQELLPSPYYEYVQDVRLRWKLTALLRENLRILRVHEEIDVLIVPTPVLEALKNEEDEVGKCRVCWLVSRAPKVCSSKMFIR